jgi:VanZ family protein
VLSRMDRKLVRWLPVLFWMGLIFYLSAQPDLPHHPDDMADLILKKMGHMAEYGVLAGLVWWAWPKSGGRSSRHVTLYAFIFSGLYAISDEIHQFFVPGRDGRLLDVGFDLLGALLTLLLIPHLSNLVSGTEQK